MWHISNIKLCRVYGETNRMVGRQRFKHLISMGSSSPISEFILQRTANQGLKQIRAFLTAYLQELKWSNIPNVHHKMNRWTQRIRFGHSGVCKSAKMSGRAPAGTLREGCTKGQMQEAHEPAPLVAMGPGGGQEREVIVRTINLQFGKMGTC